MSRRPANISRSTGSGHRPMTRQARVSSTMAARIDGPASVACRAHSLRGSPRKTTPATLVKQAAARPPIRASETMVNRQSSRVPPARLSPWKAA